MKTISIVLLGVGGYATTYVNHLRKLYEANEPIEICGIIDPYWEKSTCADWLREKAFPVYPTIEAFYANQHADIAMISTPISLHVEQCLYAMQHGSHVLVEKPLCATVQDARKLAKVSEQTKKFLAVGFQWCFSEAIMELKEDVLAGKLGKPIAMYSFVSFKRYDPYYVGTWRGKYRDKEGRWTLDCVLTNATAHYLQNLFFVNGEAMNRSALPNWIKAESYAIKHDMETPDLFIMRGELPGKVPFWHACSYSLSGDELTFFEFTFEKATVRLNLDKMDTHIRAAFTDGYTKDYGNPNDNVARKIDLCLSRVRDEQVQLPCVTETTMPHLVVSNAILEKCPRHVIPENMLVRQQSGNSEGTFGIGIKDSLLYAMGKGLLPSELGYSWATPAIEFNPGDYISFDGVYGG